MEKKIWRILEKEITAVLYWDETELDGGPDCSVRDTRSAAAEIAKLFKEELAKVIKYWRKERDLAMTARSDTEDALLEQLNEIQDNAEAQLVGMRELLLRSFWAVGDGREPLDSDRPVQFVGVYTLRWGHVDNPTIGFGRWEEEELDKVLQRGKDEV